MIESTSTQALNQASLATFRELFSQLAPPQLSTLEGTYRAAFIGPWWLRAIAGPGLWPLGLGGWWGKRFDGRGWGTNIVRRRGVLLDKLPIEVVEAPSLLDGKPAIAVIYPPGSPFPWPWVIDELRQLDETYLLGMTLVKRSPFNRFALPFLLHPHER